MFQYYAEDAAVPEYEAEIAEQIESESVNDVVSVSGNAEAVATTEEVQSDIIGESEKVDDTQEVHAGIVSDELEVVHATAQFENCPYRDFTQEDISSIERFICNEEHLTRNIARIEIDLKANLEAQIRLHVRKKNLWESPKTYIWKFLGGDNFWERENGTKIRLRRIHVK